VLYLSEDHVRQLDPGIEVTIDVVSEALAALGNGGVTQAPKAGLHPTHDSLLHALAAMSPDLGAIGVKCVSYFAANTGKGIPASSALLILNDYATGLPLCLIEALWLTRARTGACAAVAARHLARSDARVLALVGCGPVARACVPFLAATVPTLERVQIAARSRDSARGGVATLAQELAAAPPHRTLDLKAYDSPQEALAAADIVISAIGHPAQPPLRSEWLRAGMLALPLEGEAAWDTPAFHLADRVIADDAEVLRGGFARTRAGEPAPIVDAELGEVVAGLAPGRRDQDERIIDSNNGIGILDVALGQRLYREALATGIGTRL
jgi:alanine dehydrogenase